jgi:hypothetical protein
MQVVFAPLQKFFRRGVTPVTARRAPVERRDVRKSLISSTSNAYRAAPDERARRAPRLDRLTDRPREIVKTSGAR